MFSLFAIAVFRLYLLSIFQKLKSGKFFKSMGCALAVLGVRIQAIGLVELVSVLSSHLYHHLWCAFRAALRD